MRFPHLHFVTAHIVLVALTLIGLSPRAQAQAQYTIADLGTLGGSYSNAFGLNAAGQAVGVSVLPGDATQHAFRTAANSPINSINPAADDLGTLGGIASEARATNDVGQVTGTSFTLNNAAQHAFRTAPNTPIAPLSDDLGTLGGANSYAYGINAAGQVVGYAYLADDLTYRAFRTAATGPIAIGDDLGTLGGTSSVAYGINISGAVVGYSWLSGNTTRHAFRTSGNSTGVPVMYDLGALGGGSSQAYGINAAGQVVGVALSSGGLPHAFRTAANLPIAAATDDLGTLAGGTSSWARSINALGQVVGYADTATDPAHAFIYSGSAMQDLNNLIPAGTTWLLTDAFGINDAGQITGFGLVGGVYHGFRLDPLTPNPPPPTSNPLAALIQPPIKVDGSSTFSSSRGVVPVKFTLTSNGAPTCDLPPASIAVTRTSGGSSVSIDNSVYVEPADSASSFRVSGCQYVYNLGASALGAGAYRVDITINAAIAGSAAFTLR